MRWHHLILGAFAALCVSASSGDARAQEFLTNAQKRVAIGAIDSICGDTWCEGDYEFTFQNIYCSRRSRACRVVFKMHPHGEPRRAVGRACDVRGVTRFADVVKDARGQRLNDGFYDRLTDCIGKLEQNPGKRKKKKRTRR